MNSLIIGGSRNIGHFLALRLLEAGHQITVLNRGISRDDLPAEIARLECDRTDYNQLSRALRGRSFDAVIDTVLYKGGEAENIVELLNGQTGHYIFISTGQVYLVRDGVSRPWSESDYDGPLLSSPQQNTYDYEEWLYGREKRAAEDTLAIAHAASGFPYTSLRLPMVNSERDTFRRLLAYYLRIQDGGPILIPDLPDHPLRHIYVGDVVQAIMTILKSGKGKGRAYNIAQDETVSLQDFLILLADIMNKPLEVLQVERRLLEANGFLPDCSPFSEMWMSELENGRSKTELGLVYTPLRTYLERIVTYYDKNAPKPPRSYLRRNAEKQFALGVSE